MSNNGNRINTLLGLYAETSIHAGTGQNTGVVDLPIQREAHTDWPCIYGSSLKGALRTDAGQQGLSQESITYVYGPDPVSGDPSKHAGALSVGDARLLLLPVRSLSSSFCWVTCPEVLRRLSRDAARAGVEMPPTIPDVGDTQALWANSNTKLFLEEYQFDARETDLDALIAHLTKFLPRDDAQAALKQRLVIISDTMFAHLCQYATPVAAHVRLNENKTVANGALWYEETLPPDTLMYAMLSATASRNKPDPEKEHPTIDAAGILNAVLDQLQTTGYLQVGGNETVGMGWFNIKEAV